MNRPVPRDLFDRPETTSVLFKPGWLADVLRLPAHDLTDRWVHAHAVLTVAESMQLAERMVEQASLARQIVVLEELLERRLCNAPRRRSSAVAELIRQRLHRNR